MLRVRLNSPSTTLREISANDFDANATLTSIATLAGSPLPRRLLQLSNETNARIFYGDLLNLARQYENDSATAAWSAAIYQNLIHQDYSPALTTEMQNRAQHRWEVLQGGGNWMDHSERFLNNLGETLSDPVPLIGMGIGGMAFRIGRLGSLRYLGRFPGLGTTGTRFLASAGGIALEAPAFSLSNYAGMRMLHPDAIDSFNFTRDLGHGYLLMASLRSFGGITGHLSRRWTTGPDVFSRLSRQALPQLGTFAGIYSAQGITNRFLTDNPISSDALFAQSLGTLIHFNLAGPMARTLWGRRWASLERNLDHHSELILNNLNSQGPLPTVTGGFGFLPALSANINGHPTRANPPNFWAMAMSSLTPEASARPGGQAGRRFFPRFSEQARLPLGESNLELLGEVRRLISSRQRSHATLLFELEPLLRSEAQKAGVSLDIWLGQALRRSSPEVVAAGGRILRRHYRDEFGTPEEIQWIRQHQILGSIPRLNEIFLNDPARQGAVLETYSDFLAASRPQVVSGMRELLSGIGPSDNVAILRVLGEIKDLGLHELIPEVHEITQRQGKKLRPIFEDTLWSLIQNYEQSHSRMPSDIQRIRHQILQDNRRIMVQERIGPAERARAAELVVQAREHRSEAIAVLKQLMAANGPSTRELVIRILIENRVQGTIPGIRQATRGMNPDQLARLAESFLAHGHTQHGSILIRSATEIPTGDLTRQKLLQLIRRHNLQEFTPWVSRLSGIPTRDISTHAHRTAIDLAGARSDATTLRGYLSFRPTEPQGPSTLDLEPVREFFARHGKTFPEPQQEPTQQLPEYSYQLRLQAAQHLFEANINSQIKTEAQGAVADLLQNAPEQVQLQAAHLLLLHFESPIAQEFVYTQLQNHNPALRNRAASILDQTNPAWNDPIHSFVDQLREVLTQIPIRFSPK